jgi:hypothetical protein
MVFQGTRASIQHHPAGRRVPERDTSCGRAVLLFTCATSFLSRLLITAFLAVIALVEVGETFSTPLQTITSIALAYVLHFVSLRVPFRFMHAENACLAVFSLAGMLAGMAHGWTALQSFSRSWFTWS